MIFAFLIFLISILNLKAIPNFKAIHNINSNSFFIIISDGIYYYNFTNYNMTNQYKLFNISENLLSKEKFDSISSNTLFNNSYIFIINNFIYHFDENKNEITCIDSLNDIGGIYSSQIIPLDHYSYFIAFVDINKNLNIYYYELINNSISRNILKNEYIDSKYFSCQLMNATFSENVLTCFYKKENSQFLEAKSFKIGYNSDIQYIFNSSILVEKNINNTNIKSIKSILSQNLSMSFVCYITDENSNCECILYDINENKLKDYGIYLNNCLSDYSSLDIIKYNNENNNIEYILYCFISKTEINLVKINENFKKIENDENGIYYIKNKLKTFLCSEFYLSYLFYKSGKYNESISIFGNCDNIISEYELTKNEKIDYIEDIRNEIHTLMNKTSLDLMDQIIPDVSIHFITTNSNISEKSTYNITLGECEEKLRNHYNISSNRNLLILRLDIFNESSLVNKVKYEVYDDNQNKLDLSVCEDTKIKIFYSIKNIPFLDIEQLKKFQKMNIDLLNPSDSFYNDICLTFFEGDSDVTLTDRRKKYFQNYTVCEENCNYDSIDLEKMKISCDCDIKKINININKTKLTGLDINITKLNNNTFGKKEEPTVQGVVFDTVKDSSYNVIKCKNLVFYRNKKDNIGFWLYLILVIIHIPIILSYIIFKEEPIKNYIIKEMEKFRCVQKIKNPIKKKIKKKKYDINSLITTNILENNRGYQNKNIIKSKSRNLYDKDNSNISKNNYSSSIRKLKIINNKNDLLKTENKNKKLKNSKNIKNKNKIKSLIIKKNNKNMNIKHFINSYFILNNNKEYITLHNYYIKPNYLFNKLSIKKGEYYNTFPILVRKNNKNVKNLPKKICFCPFLYNIINIDANNYENNNLYIKYFLYDYSYEDALIYENRKFINIFFIFLVLQEKIINTLFFRSPLELQSLRICLLLFIYSCNFSLNTLFYFSDKISIKYKYKGNNLFFFTLINNITISLISTVISSVIVFLLKLLPNSRRNIEILFKKEEKIMKINQNYKVGKRKKENIFITIGKIIKCLRIKIIIFIIIEFSLMLFFFYFTTAFCEVYKKTQKAWLIDCFYSFIISIIIEIVMAFALAVLYTVSIYKKIKILYSITILLM